MITASEIRIGNWFNDIMAGPFQWEIKDYSSYDAINCMPIPLTEEVLLACGFEKIDGWFDTFIIKDNNFPHDQFAAKGDISIKKMTAGWQIGCGHQNAEYQIGLPFYYLHQLQNIIFSMLGEELEYKPVK